MKSKIVWASLLVLFTMILTGILIQDATAFPTFAKKYETSCSTCHYAFPKLNAFGKAFENNGLRYPGGDAEFSKDEPVSLGSEGQKRVFPNAIWPGDIPGMSPLSFRLISRVNGSTTPEGKDVVNTSFEFPHELELFYAGTLGDSFAFAGEVELEHAAELGYGFRLQYRYKPFLQLKVGNVDATPIADGHRLTKAHYNYVDYKVSGAAGETRWRKVAGSGFEVFGAGNGPNNKGGFTYKVGMINGQNDDDNFDINDAKDLYGRVTYKVAGLGEIGGTEGQASETSGFYLDDSARIGGYAYIGSSTFSKDDKSFDNDFTIFGGDIDVWFSRLNLYGTYLIRKDNDPTGDGKTENNSAAAMAELDGVVYPWLVGLVRFEWTDPNTDDDKDPVTSLIPGVLVMIRANLKAFLEAQYFLDEGTRNKKGTSFTAQLDFGF